MGLRVFYFSVVVVAGAVVQLLACSSGTVAASFISAAAVSMLAHVLWRFSDLGSKQLTHEVIPGAAALTGIVAGTLVRFLQAGVHPLTWVAIPISILISAAAVLLRSRESAELCFQHRLPTTTALSCPRCRQRFCGKSDCWSGRGMRCQRCQQNEVLLFNLRDAHWWTKNFGNRVRTGNCMKCLSVAANSDVHECGQCHWQMCRRCWDLENCQCKCGWMPEDLPATLIVLMGPGKASSSGRRTTVVAGHSHQRR
jgi:hypothetical protein